MVLPKSHQPHFPHKKLMVPRPLKLIYFQYAFLILANCPLSRGLGATLEGVVHQMLVNISLVWMEISKSNTPKHILDMIRN